jgi:hypothetical protein
MSEGDTFELVDDASNVISLRREETEIPVLELPASDIIVHAFIMGKYII